MDPTKTTFSRFGGESDRTRGRHLGLQLLGALALLALVAAAVFSLSALAPSVAKASRPAFAAGQPATEQLLLPVQGNLPAAEAAQRDYPLALLSSSAKVQGDYLVVQGSVQNLADKPLSGLLAVVTLYGRDKMPRGSMDALVEKDPLPPGEPSAFRVTLKGDPEAPLFGIQFRQWHVGNVPARDDRKG